MVVDKQNKIIMGKQYWSTPSLIGKATSKFELSLMMDLKRNDSSWELGKKKYEGEAVDLA